MDLCLINKSYILGIVDEYARMPFIKIIKAKSKVSQQVINTINYFENQTELKVREFNTDNGSKFINSTITNFCNQKGIKHSTSCTYTPQNNTIIERMWRSF